jgi:hypothetical protein
MRVRFAIIGVLVLGCGTTASAPETNSNPVPVLTSLAPASVIAGGPQALSLVVTGSGFISSSQVNWNGAARPTVFDSATRLTATISAADQASPATAQVSVTTPAPGGGTSASLPFLVSAETPDAGTTGNILQNLAVAIDGGIADGTTQDVSFSADGEIAAISNNATNLIAKDTNGAAIDVFFRETCVASACTPATTLASANNAGTQAPGGNRDASAARMMSSDGRYLVFGGLTQDYLGKPADESNPPVVIFKDTCRGQPASCVPTSSVVSLSDTGQPLDFGDGGAISENARTVAFASTSSGVSGVAAGTFQIYARDMCTGSASSCTPSTVLVSASTSGGASGTQVNGTFSISNEGRYIAFQSSAKDLVANDTSTGQNIFVRDTCIGAPAGCAPATTVVSRNLSGAPASSANQGSTIPSITGNGRYVMFLSDAAGLVAQTGSGADIYLRDTCIGATSCTPQTTVLTVDSAGNRLGSSGDVRSTALLSTTGRYATFSPGAAMRAGDADDTVYAIDTCIGATAGCVSSVHPISIDGQGNAVAGLNPVAISGDGRYAALFAGDFHTLYLAKTGY